MKACAAAGSRSDSKPLSAMTVDLARMLPKAAALLACAAFCAAARAQAVPEPEQLAPGVYAFMAANEDAAPANRGMVGNVGVLVGTTGVVLIDTGTSARHAQALLAAIRGITALPVVLAINTQQNPAHVFGNGTLQHMGVPVIAHAETDALIAARCQRCLKQLVQALGEEEMAGTAVVRPAQTFDRPLTMSAGGRTLDLLYYGPTSAPGAIAVLDRESGVLFGGGLVSMDRIPDVKDADLGQWQAALRSLGRIAPARIVPGAGPVSAPDRLPELARYLAGLSPVVQAAFDQRKSLGEAAAAAPMPAYRGWALYDSMHRKNVEQIYLRLENAYLNAP